MIKLEFTLIDGTKNTLEFQEFNYIDEVRTFFNSALRFVNVGDHSIINLDHVIKMVVIK